MVSDSPTNSHGWWPANHQDLRCPPAQIHPMTGCLLNAEQQKRICLTTVETFSIHFRFISMRYLSILIVAIVLCLGCNQSNKEDQTHPPKAAIKKVTQKDSIEAVALKVLTALKAKDYRTFGALFHPVEGIRFSPYGFIDLTHKKVLGKDFLEAIDKNWTLTWGHFDGSGEAIKMKVKPYIERFIYNADYLNADEKSYDSFIGQGNTINNLKETYPGLHFIEYYFKGVDEKYKGLDWTSLRLVFKKYENEYYLVAVIHDQWTV